MALFDFESVKGKKRLNYVYSIGAAVVILGAWFKITHIPGGDIVISIGLITEAFIFIISAFEPQHLDLKWDRVYPELAENADPTSFAKPQKSTNIEASLSNKLDKMLEDAKFDLDKVEKLGTGIDKFSQATSGLVNVVDANKNAQSYSDQLAIAANHMSTLNTYYSTHAEQTASQGEISQSFMNAAKSSAQYGEELTKAAGQVKEMNKMYNSQITNMNDQVNVSGEMIKNIAVTVEDAKQMHIQVKELTDNLASLNNVYGGMLSAMNFNK